VPGRSTLIPVRFEDPRGAESAELSRLIDERLALDDRLDAIGEQQRSAAQNVQRLSDSLAELERRAAGGDKVTDSERTKLEHELAAARAKAHEPWAERAAGVQSAARDGDQQISLFIEENLDQLLGELSEDAEAAANAVDTAAHRLVAAFHERMLVESRVTALCALIRTPRPGDVVPTRAEQAVREATRLLQTGGENAPLLHADPRQPRHGARIPDETETEPIVAALS
jgi:hypothetical protein